MQAEDQGTELNRCEKNEDRLLNRCKKYRNKSVQPTITNIIMLTINVIANYDLE